MRYWLAAMAFLGAENALQANDPAIHGKNLYTGAAPLHGAIAGHRTEMPPGVLVCANCHTGSAARQAPAIQDAGDAQAAPGLAHGWLAERRSRRNGPASRYTEPGFCQTLRTGIDPLHILLPVQMPRFTISDTDCVALWAYLNAPA